MNELISKEMNSELDKLHPLVSPIFIPELGQFHNLQAGLQIWLKLTWLPITLHIPRLGIVCVTCVINTQNSGSSEAVLTHLVRSWLLFKN